MKNFVKTSFLLAQIIAVLIFAVYMNVFFAYRLIIRLFGLIVCFRLLLKRTSSSYKILYFLFLAFAPSLGIFVYLLNLKKRCEPPLKICRTDFEKSTMKYGKTASYISKTLGGKIYPAQNLKYYSDGEKYFSALFKYIELAKKYVFLQYFIVKECHLQQKLFSLLEEKSKNGVKIYFLYDALGSVAYDEKIKKFAKKCGINAKSFNPVGWLLNGKINNRHHGKIAVVDGKIGFLGGVNVGDEYVNEIKKYGRWKDGGISFCGPAVGGLIEEFQCNFGERITEFAYEITENKEANDKSYVCVFSSKPSYEISNMAEVYLTALYNARKRITACTPYLVLDDNVKNALIAAVKRGVDVKIIIPEIPDKKAVYAVTKSYATELLSFGVKIYVYRQGFMHAKNTVIDGKYVITGSGNLDYRSMYLHYETAAFIKSGEFCKIIESDILGNIKKYNENKNFISKTIIGLLRIFAPLM